MEFKPNAELVIRQGPTFEIHFLSTPPLVDILVKKIFHKFWRYCYRGRMKTTWRTNREVGSEADRKRKKTNE